MLDSAKDSREFRMGSWVFDSLIYSVTLAAAVTAASFPTAVLGGDPTKECEVLFDGAHRTADWRSAYIECSARAEEGDAGAQYRVGVIYANGRSVEPDDDAAVQWYRKAATQGYATAHMGLGIMYYYGRGVAQDPLRAYKWWTIAALLEEPAAETNQEIAAKQLTPAEIEESQGWAEECLASGYQGCQ